MVDRLSAVRESLRANGLDALCTTNVSDIRWMTGFTEVFDSERAHLAIVADDLALIHTDSRYSDAMRSRAEDGEWAIDSTPCRHASLFAAKLAELPHDGAWRICIDADIPLSEYRALTAALAEAGIEFEFVEGASPARALREVKDSSEIELLYSVQAIADDAFLELMDWIEPGMTELSVATELEYRMKRLGAQSASFPTIVASGPNGANPHSVAGQRKLEAGDLVIIDYGARCLDYCSDTTRTISIGEPSAELRRIYDLTLEAHNRCKELVKPGVHCRDVHNLAAEIIADGGYAGKFNHGLGHGVGIDVHEGPTMNSRYEGVLKVGNVVTVEPGIYIPGLGGVRIEDCGVVDDDGFRSFTKLTHELIVV